MCYSAKASSLGRKPWLLLTSIIDRDAPLCLGKNHCNQGKGQPMGHWWVPKDAHILGPDNPVPPFSVHTPFSPKWGFPHIWILTAVPQSCWADLCVLLLGISPLIPEFSSPICLTNAHWSFKIHTKCKCNTKSFQVSTTGQTILYHVDFHHHTHGMYYLCLYRSDFPLRKCSFLKGMVCALCSESLATSRGPASSSSQRSLIQWLTEFARTQILWITKL